MAQRQQVLYLWLAEAALVMPVVAWAFHDGSDGEGPGLPDGDPPYATGDMALKDGWMLLQSPHVPRVEKGQEHEPAYLSYEFVFERRVDIAP